MLELAQNDLLLARARKGEAEALEELYRAYEGPVFTLARRLCRSPQEAEEVLQETFLEVMRSLPAFRGDAPVWHWIKRVAETKALMRMRSARRHPEDSLDESPEPSAGPPQENLPEWLDLRQAVELLPPASRAVLWLHDVEGHTHEEIAGLMGMTTSFSKSQLSRAHERLRRLLAPKEEERTHAPGPR